MRGQAFDHSPPASWAQKSFALVYFQQRRLLNICCNDLRIPKLSQHGLQGTKVAANTYLATHLDEGRWCRDIDIPSAHLIKRDLVEHLASSSEIDCVHGWRGVNKRLERLEVVDMFQELGVEFCIGYDVSI